MGFSIGGLVSGLDTGAIIEGLVGLQQAQVDRLEVQQSEIETERAAFQGIEARVLSFRSNLVNLNRSTSSVFDPTEGTSSDESIVTVSTDSGAAEGSFLIRVNSLARAQQIGSQGFDESATIPTGEISFQVGGRPATNITIDDSNNTPAGLVDAINDSSADVSASIVFDQANSANRILLTSRESGVANEITVTNNLAAATGSETRPDFSGPAIQEAANAQVQLGSGPGAIVAEFDTNTVEGLIENVTLNLQAADVDQEIDIQISRDTEPARSAIENFVSEFNSLIDFIDTQTAFNPETGQGSPLLGNRNVSNIQNSLAALVTDIVPGADPSLNRFSQLGIDIGGNGRLSINSTELDQALSGELEGVGPDDIGRLFQLSGQSSNSGIEFLVGSTRTASSSAPIEVDILQSAERGSVAATDELASSITIDASNNQFQLTLDGLESETLTLANGTFSPEQLATLVQNRINGSVELGNSEVAVNVEDGRLNFTSQRFGRSSSISAFSGTALDALGLDGSEEGIGQDVAGSFIVDGVVESATGSGRTLIGDSNNENTADLQIRVDLNASQIGNDSEGTLQISRGISSRIDQFFGEILDTEVGTLSTIDNEFALQIESLDESIARVNAISEAQSQSLVEQFATLERVLSDLQNTSSFLSSQLSGL